MKQHITIVVIATFIISIVIGVAQVAATTNRIIALPTPQRQALQVSGQVTPWGVAAATPNNGITYTPSNTRTPFMLTRTMLARQSPTFFAQTRTATWFAVRASQTSAAVTQTAIPTATYLA